MKNFIFLMRPKQWFKSLYIAIGSIPAIFLMPVRFDLIVFYLFIGILNMILLQGVIYIINDITDLKEDKLHPKKKFRPIASGKVSIKGGLVFASFLFFLAIFMAFLLDFRIFLIDIALLLNNLAYSIKPIRFRDRPFLDVCFAALNFPLRVMVGWYLFEPYNEARLSFQYVLTSTKLDSKSIQSLFFNAHPMIINLSIRFSTITLSFASMMLITYFMAIFLLSMKRLAEKIQFKKAEKMRKVLKYYSIPKLKAMGILSAIVSCFSFIFFALSLKPLLSVLVFPLIYLFIYYYKLVFVRSDIVSRPEIIFKEDIKFTTILVLTAFFALILLLW